MSGSWPSDACTSESGDNALNLNLKECLEPRFLFSLDCLSDTGTSAKAGSEALHRG